MTATAKTERGYVVVSLAVLMLALIGAWYVVRGYQENRLRERLTLVFDDYRIGIRALVKSPEDQAKLDQAFGQIDAIINKYKGTSPNTGGQQ